MSLSFSHYDVCCVCGNSQIRGKWRFTDHRLLSCGVAGCGRLCGAADALQLDLQSVRLALSPDDLLLLRIDLWAACDVTLMIIDDRP
jgi:hypothetical protein